MDVYEITGYQTGVSKAGVNFLQPKDSFQNIIDGFVYRQVLQSRQGVGYFAPRLAGKTRVMGIFEHILPDSTKELLAFDTNFLYKYNTGTGVFDPIPFAGSMAAYAGFNIVNKEDYISGTSYPTATNGARFIFTGNGIAANGAGSSIFFYNGTDVRDFTAIADSPNYVAPAMGALTKATYVLWFNERLNFIVPVIGAIAYNQGVLYSGIRTVSGNGDNFNVAGSGLFQADTPQNINGATILGQVLALHFNRMNYTLEKTKDAFNPYFGRAVPGVLGTNAKFSAVSWDETVKSMGRTGIINSDGRKTLRTDDKTPNFTTDEIDQLDFNLIYGGFDRVNNQFLWAYKENEANTTTQNKVLVNNYEEGTWSVFNQRLSCFGQTDLGLNLTWNQIDETTGNESWAKWNTTEEIWNKIGIGLSVQKTLAGDDMGFIYNINQDYDDYFANITAISNASQAVLTVSPSAFKVGDLVTIQNVVGMLDAQGNSGINNFDSTIDTVDYVPYEIIAATDVSITINMDTSLLTPYTSGGSIQKVISFSAETIPFNPYREIGRRCYISHVEFLLDTDGGSLRVDVVSDEEESPFIDNVLCLPSSTSTKAREWISMSVDNESNFMTFIMRQVSPSTQVRLTSMRIHCEAGGLTSG